MKFLIFIIILALSQLFTSCGIAKGKYFVKVNQVLQPTGLLAFYKIDNDKLTIESDCDFQDCEKKLVYTKKLSQEQSKSFYEFLIKLRIDTLQNVYEREGMLDGYWYGLEINCYGLGHKKVSISNTEVPAAILLCKEIDKYIDSSNYRFYRSEY